MAHGSFLCRPAGMTVAAVLTGLALASAAAAQDGSEDTGTPIRHPLLEAPKDRSAGERALRAPVTLLEFPFKLLGDGLEETLHFVEQGTFLQDLAELPVWLEKRHIILTGGNQGNGSGWGVGGGVFANVGRGKLIARTQWTVYNYQTHTLELHQPLSGSTRLHAYGRYRQRTRDNFYGVGRDSRDDDQTQYELSDVDAGLNLAFAAGPWAVILGGGWTDYGEVKAGRGDEPATLDVFPGLDGADGATLISGAVTLRYPAVLYLGGRAPESGVEATARIYHDAEDEAFGFARYSLALYRTVPLFWGDRVLAVRTWVSMTDRADGQTVPFWMLNNLGGAQGLRGFDPLRFRDNDAALITVEYRFPIWDIGLPGGLGMDALAFVDTGMVSPGLEDDLILAELETDFGFGFRIRTDAATTARMNVAFGGDDAFRIEFKTGRDF
ncbi:MAG: hypothetical protein HKN12_07705 [Gemmatimonadetes bacterium]|nr:hypothetical protein [Gemmatimonadota bacterium]